MNGKWQRADSLGRVCRPGWLGQRSSASRSTPLTGWRRTPAAESASKYQAPSSRCPVALGSTFGRAFVYAVCSCSCSVVYYSGLMLSAATTRTRCSVCWSARGLAGSGAEIVRLLCARICACRAHGPSVTVWRLCSFCAAAEVGLMTSTWSKPARRSSSRQVAHQSIRRRRRLRRLEHGP